MCLLKPIFTLKITFQFFDKKIEFLKKQLDKISNKQLDKIKKKFFKGVH